MYPFKNYFLSKRTPVEGIFIFLSPFASSGILVGSVVAETTFIPFFMLISVTPPEVRVAIMGMSEDLMRIARPSEDVIIISIGLFS